MALKPSFRLVFYGTAEPVPFVQWFFRDQIVFLVEQFWSLKSRGFEKADAFRWAQVWVIAEQRLRLRLRRPPGWRGSLPRHY